MSSSEYKIPVAVHVGTLIKEWLEENNMSGREFAIRTGKPEKTISNIINGKSRITKETADSFEIVTGISSAYLLRFQANYDSALTRVSQKDPLEYQWECWGALFPYNDMTKKGWVPKATTRAEKMRNLLRFFSLTHQAAYASQYENLIAGVHYRLSGNVKRTPYGISSWIRRGEILANNIEVSEYSPQKATDSIPLFKKALFEKDTCHLSELCRQVGIILVFVENIPSASISGAVKKKENTPIIMLSGKGRTLDKLVFNFFHELGHILLDHVDKKILVDDIEDRQDSLEEREANDFAVKTLFRDFVAFPHKPNEREIRTEAARLGLPPCILLGHLLYTGVFGYAEAGARFKSLFENIDPF